MFKKYSEKYAEIKSLNVPLKMKLIYFIFSLSLAILSMSGLICIAINLLLFRDFQKILCFLISTFVCFTLFLTSIFIIS